MRNRNINPLYILPALTCWCFLLMWGSCDQARAFEFSDGVWKLDAMVVRDPLLPMPPREELEKALRAAEENIQFKFQQKVSFRLLEGETLIGDYSNSVEKSTGLRLFFTLMSRRLHKLPMLYLAPDEKMMNNAVKSLNGDWGYWGGYDTLDIVGGGSALEKMKRFLPPEERGREFTAEKVVERLSKNVLYWNKLFKNLLGTDGRLYFRNGGNSYNKFAAWLNLLRHTKGADMVITNTPIMAWEYWTSTPHINAGQGVIHGTVGGSLDPKWKPGVSLLTVFPSHISMDAKMFAPGTLPPGKSQTTDVINPNIHKNFTADERIKYIAYIITHESGHQLFDLPDTSSPALKGCIMQRDYETLDDRYFFGLSEKRGPCFEEVLTASTAEARQWARRASRQKAMGIFKRLKRENVRDDGALQFIASEMIRCGYKNEAEGIITALLAKAKDEKARNRYMSLWYDLRRPPPQADGYP